MLPLTLDLAPSRRLVAIFVTFHCLAWTSLIFSSVSLAIQLPTGACIGLSLLFNYARYGNPRSRWFINRINCSPDGRWTLHTVAGTIKPVGLASSYVHSQVVILTFATGKFSRYPLVILPDSADRNTVRRLRVCLQNLPGSL